MSFSFSVTGATPAEALASFEAVLDQVAATEPGGEAWKTGMVAAAEQTLAIIGAGDGHALTLSADGVLVDGFSATFHVGAQFARD